MPVYAARKGLTPSCYFEPEALAATEGAHFTRINYEGYFFCKPEERARFLADPIAYCGLLTDPVSKLRFRPQADSKRAEHEGVLFFFAGDETAQLFAQAPGDFFLPGYEMEEEEAQPEPTG